MTLFVDYNQILLDAKTLLDANASALGIKRVLTNANDRDYETFNMPMVDLRIARALTEPLAGRNDYVQVVVEVEVSAFDMTNRQEAAKMRDDLTSGIQKLFQQNPRFNSASETVTLGPAEFGTGENLDEQGVFGAASVFELNVFLYVDG